MTGLLSPFGWCVLAIGVLSLLGLPIGLSMIGGSVLYLAVSGQDIGIAAEQLVQGLTNTYTLLAIPLFILAAEIMTMGSLSDRLLAWCNALVGRFRGGMGHVNVVSSLIFSGMSGSAIADVVGVGKLTMDMMTKDAANTYVQDVNWLKLTNRLAAYTGNLLADLQNQHPNYSVEQVIGGYKIQESETASFAAFHSRR